MVEQAQQQTDQEPDQRLGQVMCMHSLVDLHRRPWCVTCRTRAIELQQNYERGVQFALSELDDRFPALVHADERFFYYRDDRHVTCIHGNLARYGGSCTDCQAMTWKLGDLL